MPGGGGSDRAKPIGLLCRCMLRCILPYLVTNAIATHTSRNLIFLTSGREIGPVPWKPFRRLDLVKQGAAKRFLPFGRRFGA